MPSILKSWTPIAMASASLGFELYILPSLLLTCNAKYRIKVAIICNPQNDMPIPSPDIQKRFLFIPSVDS